MTEKQLQANVWFYQDFLNDAQKQEFWLNRPEDWSRLQIFDGSTMKPAMEPGFKGHPTPEQVMQLHELATQGKLFFFELGNTGPRQLGNVNENQKYLDPNPQPPIPPKPLPPNAGSSEQVSHEYYLSIYNQNMRHYQTNLEVLKTLGDGFKNAVIAYNEKRDMAWENAEKNAREDNFIIVGHQRNRDKADRVIDGLFGPKPTHIPEVVYQNDHPADESVFKLVEFQEQLEPNIIDLPENSKLSARDVATINLAMMGSKGPVEKAARERGNVGPLNAVFMGNNGFNMLMTGMFGYPRKNQSLPGDNLMGDVLKEGQKAIELYNAGDPTLLGQYLGTCIRTIKDVFTDSANNSLSEDVVAASRLTERIQELFQKNPDLLQAANLQENELAFMHGYVQMGKVYDNYLSGIVKQSEAKAHGKTLTTEEKAEILADAVLRAMVEKELAADNKKVTESEEYQTNLQEAIMQDQLVAEEEKLWKAEVMSKIADSGEATEAKKQYELEHDLNMHSTLATSVPVDHKVIALLGQPGMLERLRQNLQKDPSILAAAAKEPMQFSTDALKGGPAIKTLADQVAPTLKSQMISDQQKQAWFDSMKAMVTGGQDLNALSPWLSASVETDAGRLMIAVPGAEGGKELVSVASLLKGGLKDLENPTQQALDLMYRHAMEGNLYYYQVGQTLPQRLTANGAEASAEQIKAPVEPTVWHWIANILTFGRAYRDILYPTPDRDPAAVDGILRSSDGRTLTITVEVAAHDELRQAAEQARKANEDRIKDDVSNFRRVPDGNVPREFPQYDLDTVEQKLKDMAYVETLEVKDKLLAGEMTTSGVYILDRLCADNPTQQQIREAMAAAVLLEAVKEERLAGTGDAVRTQLVRNRKGTVQSMVNNETFQAFTRDASMDMLKHFLMTDGARNMYQAMKDIATNRAKQQELGKEANVMEQNMQKKNENPIAGLS